MGARWLLQLLLLALLFAAPPLARGTVGGEHQLLSEDAASGFGAAQAGEARVASMPPPAVDAARISAQIEALGRLSEHDPPNVTRLVFSPQDRQARQLVKAAMLEAGLEVREDPMGNIFGRLAGSQPGLGAVGSGSHTDAIPHAGRYDGVVGVLGAIEALAALQRAGFVPRRPLEAVMFTSEEPTRFGVGCVGSRVLSGAYSSAQLDALQDGTAAGQRQGFATAAAAAGYGSPRGTEGIVDGSVLEAGYYSAFVELHIEQGPLLEQEGANLGVVTAIAAPASLVVEFEGSGGHAGALLMHHRRDAGLAAAELALAVEAAAGAAGAEDAVATTGVMAFFPGAVNSVPSAARVEVDVRDIDEQRRDAMVRRIEAAAAEISARRRTPHRLRVVNQDPPAACAPAVVAAVEASAAQLSTAGLPAHARRMVSRAYHDSLFMARVAPTGMIFIPCRGGVSHRPDEYASLEDIALGTQALALTLARLAA